MRLLPKWFIIFIVTGIYVTVLAGLFYRNLFTWFFREKLRLEVEAVLYVNQNKFISGLLDSPRVITIEEVDTMKSFLNDKRIVYGVVINKSGYVRWSPDVQLFGKHIREFEQVHALPTLAIARAMATKSPRTELFKRESKEFFEIAVPLVHQGDIRGVVSLEVSLEEAKATIAVGMRKFYTGAVGVVVLFLVTGVVFLYLFVLSPIRQIKDNIDNLSVVGPAWPEAGQRKDEFGDLEKSLISFFGKLKSTVTRYESDRKDYMELEKNRWEHILKVLVPSGCALVLDGDNYCLASCNLDYIGLKPELLRSAASSRRMPVFNPQDPSAPGIAPSGGKTHLLDLVTGTELLQLINKALEKPGQFVSGPVTLKDVPYNAKVITLAASSAQDQRTIAWLNKS